MEKIKKTPLTGESPAQSKTNNFIWNLKVKQGGQPKKQKTTTKKNPPQATNPTQQYHYNIFPSPPGSCRQFFSGRTWNVVLILAASFCIDDFLRSEGSSIPGWKFLVTQKMSDENLLKTETTVTSTEGWYGSKEWKEERPATPEVRALCAYSIHV